MNFYIRQHSTEPVLKLRLIDDGKTDKSSFNEKLETSIITLDIINANTNEPEFLGLPCFLSYKTTKYNNITDELFIVFKFSKEHTAKKGVYEGIINVSFFNETNTLYSDLILPIKEKLIINII